MQGFGGPPDPDRQRIRRRLAILSAAFALLGIQAGLAFVTGLLGGRLRLAPGLLFLWVAGGLAARDPRARWAALASLLVLAAALASGPLEIDGAGWWSPAPGVERAAGRVLTLAGLAGCAWGLWVLTRPEVAARFPPRRARVAGGPPDTPPRDRRAAVPVASRPDRTGRRETGSEGPPPGRIRRAASGAPP